MTIRCYVFTCWLGSMSGTSMSIIVELNGRAALWWNENGFNSLTTGQNGDRQSLAPRHWERNIASNVTKTTENPWASSGPARSRQQPITGLKPAAVGSSPPRRPMGRRRAGPAHSPLGRVFKTLCYQISPPAPSLPLPLCVYITLPACLHGTACKKMSTCLGMPIRH